MTLRAKGIFALLAMFAYAGAMYAYIEHERSTLLADVAALEGLRESEDKLTRAGIAISDALFIVHRGIGANGEGIDDLPSELEELEGSLKRLGESSPLFATRLSELRLAQKELADHHGMAGLYGVRAPLIAIGHDVDHEVRDVHARRARLNADVRRTYDRIGALTLALGIGGLALFGMLTLLFFTRLSVQLGALRERAGAIVRGYRGPPLASRRRDELGVLSRAIDGMAADLVEKERQLDLGLRRQMHAETMATVGAMAAKVAHEIGNPLAIISGAAQELADAAPTSDAARRHAAMIVSEAERIRDIALRMTRLAGSGQPADSADLNAVTASAVELARFDPRFARKQITLEPAAALPAAKGDPRTVTHIVMTLLLAAAEHREAPLRLRTGLEAGLLFVAADGAADAARIAIAQQLAAEMGATVELREPGCVLFRLSPQPTEGMH
ncbi:MAG TPA: histidine kinase dimerization/phospho-acceptor domain-containing protein [Burkholderiales bacterium]